MISFLARAVPGDEHWDVQFGWSGPGGNSEAITTHDGKLYALGFAVSTNVPLEVWDGAQWTVLAQFHGSISGTVVRDLTFVGGTLYAAGIFTNVNGVAANGLAQWDGTNWSGVGNFSGIALGLTVDSGNLYVGGAFTNPAAGGVVATNIAYWDGSIWHALGDGLGYVSGSTYAVGSIAIQSGLIYAGGAFTNSGANSISNLAVWDGTGWSAVGGGVNGFVEALVFNGSDLYAGGTFSQAGATAAKLIAMWDGANWNALGTGLTGSFVFGLATFNGSVYATGTFTNAGAQAINFGSWNGSSWVGSGFGLNANGYRVYATATNVYVGGLFTLAGGLIANGLAGWDGSQWSTIGTLGRLNGAASSVRTFAGAPTNLFAGGLFSTVGQITNGSLVARFDGANWYSMGGGVSGPAGSVVNALATSNNNVYVGGSFTSAGGVSAQNIAQWDGANWSALGAGPGGVVASIVVVTNAVTNGVYVAGAPQSGATFGSPFFSHWDGASWQSALAFEPGTLFVLYQNDTSFPMGTLVAQGTNIFIGGHFFTINPGITCSNIMRFDGTFGQPMGTGVNSNVVAMTVLGTNLYVAGLFTNAGGVAASHIAKWDGTAWSGVGGGVVGIGTVNALTTIGTNLYAGGTFTNMGGVAASRIAKWDGNTWSALGSGVSSINNAFSVLGLYSSGANLYAGGSFRIAGGKPSMFLGLWNDQVNFNTPQLSNAAWLGNGEFRVRVYEVSGTTNVVEATTNFSSWTPVSTNSTGVYDFIDASGGSFPWRFYRAKLLP